MERYKSPAPFLQIEPSSRVIILNMVDVEGLRLERQPGGAHFAVDEPFQIALRCRCSTAARRRSWRARTPTRSGALRRRSPASITTRHSLAGSASTASTAGAMLRLPALTTPRGGRRTAGLSAPLRPGGPDWRRCPRLRAAPARTDRWDRRPPPGRARWQPARRPARVGSEDQTYLGGAGSGRDEEHRRLRLRRATSPGPCLKSRRRNTTPGGF